ncbi:MULTISPECIES: hypothetical protein [unclassified Streptomyces]|uniref:hypothetical protein n=1 Tax=unclassified Streptomyces TaxID=2593676 RepID=UPI0037F1F0E3
MPDQGEGGKNRKKWQAWTRLRARTAVGIVVTVAAVVTAAADVTHAIEVISRHL